MADKNRPVEQVSLLCNTQYLELGKLPFGSEDKEDTWKTDCRTRTKDSDDIGKQQIQLVWNCLTSEFLFSEII